jgi:hypothetical protein
MPWDATPGYFDVRAFRVRWRASRPSGAGRGARNVGLAADLGQQRKERPRVVDDPPRQDLVAGLVEDRDVRALAMQVDTDRIHPWASSHPDLSVRPGE